MSLSRVLAPGLNGPKITVVVTRRTDVSIPKYYDPEEHQKIDNFRKSYLGQGTGGAAGDAPSVGLIGRIIARFNGEALPGEKEAPKALFANAGQHFLPPKPLPPVPADFKEHPERDLKNFPFPARFMFPIKTHFLYLPDSWFQAFHKVSGASGPYAFIFSYGAFLVNKEYIVWDHNIAVLIFGWLFWFGFARHAWEPQIDEWKYKLWAKHIEKHKIVIQDDLDTVKNFKKIQAARKDALVTAKENFPAILKENMDLQLEVTYRKNIEKFATELKRRVDYLKETEGVKQRLERNIYVSQIIEGVRKQIENNENGIKDAYLDYCIDQLKVLAAKEGTH